MYRNNIYSDFNCGIRMGKEIVIIGVLMSASGAVLMPMAYYMYPEGIIFTTFGVGIYIIGISLLRKI